MRRLNAMVASCLSVFALWAIAVPIGQRVASGAVVQQGYAIVTALGTVATFGDAAFEGDYATTGATSNGNPVVAVAATADRGGYWLVSANGAVAAFGDAEHPSARWPGVGHRVVAIAPDGATGGYWLVDRAGAVRAVAAPGLGALPAPPDPVVGAVPAGTAGLWLATASGAVLTVGPSAVPAPGHHAETDVVGIAATPSGLGYWLVNASGHVVAAGDAVNFGSAARLPKPVRAIVPSIDGGGYLLVLENGTVKVFGDAHDEGDVSTPLHPPLYPAFYSPPAPAAVGAAYLAPGPGQSRSGPLRVTFLGDSLSVLTAQDTTAFLAKHHDPTEVTNGGIQGCGITGGLDVATPGSPGPPKATLPACGDWVEQYEWEIAVSHPNVVAVLVGYWECQEHSIFGSPFTLSSSADYRSYVAVALESIIAIARNAGARVVLLNAPYFGDGTPAARVDLFNSIVDAVAAEQEVPLFDLRSLLDPNGRYQASIDGVAARRADGVHVTPAGVETFVDPTLVPELDALAAADRFSGPTG